MPKYAVVTPEYLIHNERYDPPEPPEYGCDYLEVEAPTAREAKILAVCEWRKRPRRNNYVARQLSDDCNPFTGLKAELITEEMEDAAPH